MTRIISITGTPGTGKTVVAKALAKALNANLISISALVSRREVRSTPDKARNTRAVDIADLQKAVNRKLKSGTNIIDGHLSHHLKSHATIVLRCNPAELSKRLRAKKWKKAKIRENVEAELIGIISAEAKQRENRAPAAKIPRVIEIDTTRKKPKAVAGMVVKALKHGGRSEQIDWLLPGILMQTSKALK